MEAKAYLKNVKISPKKLRFLLPELKKLKPTDALNYLMYTPKKGAKILYKAIKSAISNAKTSLGNDASNLRFKTLLAEEGQKLKRFNPGGRGTIKPFIKRMSHIKIVLEAKQSKIPNLNVKSNPKSQVKKIKIS